MRAGYKIAIASSLPVRRGFSIQPWPLHEAFETEIPQHILVSYGLENWKYGTEIGNLKSFSFLEFYQLGIPKFMQLANVVCKSFIYLTKVSIGFTMCQALSQVLANNDSFIPY